MAPVTNCVLEKLMQPLNYKEEGCNLGHSKKSSVIQLFLHNYDSIKLVISERKIIILPSLILKLCPVVVAIWDFPINKIKSYVKRSMWRGKIEQEYVMC